MSKHYILIKEVDVQKMSAMNNYLVTGFPGLTSFAGYIESIKITIQSILNKKVENISFSVIVHDYVFNHGIERHVRYTKSEKPIGQINPPSMKVEFKCNGKLSFLIKFELDEEDIFEDNYELVRKESDNLKESIAVLRIAGGLVTTEDMFIDLFENEESLLKASLRLSNGFFIKNADDLMAEYCLKFNGDALKAIIHALEIVVDDSEENNKFKRRQKGWVCATNVGYQFLTEPYKNKGARDDLDFRYAEPITSLIKYIKSKKILLNLLSDKTSFKEEKIMFTSETNDIEYRIKPI